MGHSKKFNLDEKFVFSSKFQRAAFITLGLGIVLFVIGVVSISAGGGDSHDEHALTQTVDLLASAQEEGSGEAAHAEEGDAHGGGHHGYHWTTRIKSTLWHNSIFFLGISVIGIFFVALQYGAHAGWSALIKRIPESFGIFVPVAGIVLLITFFWGNHEIFHWTHDYLYDPNSPQYDEIIAGKAPVLNFGFFIGATIIFIAGWYGFYHVMRNHSLAEDNEGGVKRFWKIKTLATVFIIFFAVSSSIASWIWILSIDTHWFSTMFGWYVFASWFVTGLSVITLFVIFLKKAGYLAAVNENHIHDLGKFVFAFSVFWTYIWFSQFLLIYYANIPEETIYFMERLTSDYYSQIFFFNIVINFFFPFLALMTRNAKRKMNILRIVCFVVIIGHWFDFYLMITPGVLKDHGSLGPLEVGTFLIFAGLFLFIVGKRLASAPLIAKNHPMMDESLHHSI